jgi:hypothetical protein
VVEFSNQKGLQRWLNDKTREWSVVIAARTSLRVIPSLVLEVDPRDTVVRRNKILPTFRGNLAAWISSAWPGQVSEKCLLAAADAAAEAANDGPYPNRSAAYAAQLAAGVSGGDLAAYAAFFASRAVGRSARAAIARSGIARASVARAGLSDGSSAADIWAGVSADSSELESEHAFRPESLAIQALWPTRMPQWAAENWDKLKLALLEADEDWEVWTDWYESRLRGGRTKRSSLLVCGSPTKFGSKAPRS